MAGTGARYGPVPAPRPARATVVVPTFRRPEGLERVLGGLALQADPGLSWDVLVVDNDDAPGSLAAFERAARDLGVPVRLVREERRGASCARNRGIEDAAGDVVVFLDDDVEPAPDWLRRLLEPIRAGRCEATGGRVVLDPEVRRPRWLRHAGLERYLAAHDLGPAERDLGDGEFVITASAAFVADLLRRTGGMDPALGPRTGVQLVNDDVLLCDRFRDVGGRIRWVPEALVVHELPATRMHPRYLLRRAWSQGRSDWLYFTRTIGRRAGVERQLGWFADAMRRRWRERPWRLPVAFHAACDVARLSGATFEAARRARYGFR